MKNVIDKYVSRVNIIISNNNFFYNGNIIYLNALRNKTVNEIASPNDKLEKVDIKYIIDGLGSYEETLLSGYEEGRYFYFGNDRNVKVFIEKYQEVIDSEVMLNNEIKILMIYGTLKEEQAYYLCEQTYEYLKPLYNNLYIHKFDGDNTAASNHAFVTAHNRMAEELKAVIRSILK